MGSRQKGHLESAVSGGSNSWRSAAVRSRRPKKRSHPCSRRPTISIFSARKTDPVSGAVLGNFPTGVHPYRANERRDGNRTTAAPGNENTMMALQWFYWGVLATLAQTLFDAAAVGLRLTRMSLPMMLGTMWTPNRSRATVIGFANHIVNGLLFTLVYVAAFHFWGRHGWWLGALVGLAQAAFVLLVGMQILPAIHPRMATEQSGPLRHASTGAARLSGVELRPEHPDCHHHFHT